MVSIKELADNTGFKGSNYHKIAEPTDVRNLPVIDNTSRFSKSNVRTSIDCYVAGQYVQRNGKIIEVMQRYSVFISYNQDTQYETLSEARKRIIDDFDAKYGRNFNVTTVFVPAVPAPATDLPQEQGQVTDLQFYGGSKLFRGMTKYERYRYDVGTEKDVHETNLDNIKKRYGYR